MSKYPERLRAQIGDTLQEAIDAAGGQVALAKKIGVTQSMISKYLRCANRIPPEVAMQIEKHTGVSWRRIRVDLFEF